MGRQFDVEYDDFSGGHWVGPSEVRQPMNTWQGLNAICTADEGYLMHDGGWDRSSAKYNDANGDFTTLPLHVATGSGFFFSSAGCCVGTGQKVKRWVNGSPVTVATGLPTAVANYSHQAMDLNGYVLSALASGNYARSSLSTGYIDQIAPTTGKAYRGVWAWKNWLLYVDFGSLPNRVYFNDPNAPTTWPANNYFDIGAANYIIESVVTTGDSILFATREGWWAVTGVLGETTTIRKINKRGINTESSSLSPPGVTGAETAYGIMTPTSYPSGVLNVSGASTQRMMTTDDVSPNQIGTCVQAGTHILASGSRGSTTPYMWVWSEESQRWRKTSPGLGLCTHALIPAEDRNGYGDLFYAVGKVDQGSGINDDFFYSTFKEPIDPLLRSGAFGTTQVSLADYVSKRKFVVKEVLAEVAFGRTVGAGSAQRRLTVNIVTNPIEEVGVTYSLTGSSSLQANYNSIDTETDRTKRASSRFPVNDAGPTYVAQVVVSLTGVKLRRVIMRCEEV